MASGTDRSVVPWALTALPGDMPAGASRPMEALVRVPAAPGRFDLVVDPVTNGVAGSTTRIGPR